MVRQQRNGPSISNDGAFRDAFETATVDNRVVQKRDDDSPTLFEQRREARRGWETERRRWMIILDSSHTNGPVRKHRNTPARKESAWNTRRMSENWSSCKGRKTITSTRAANPDEMRLSFAGSLHTGRVISRLLITFTALISPSTRKLKSGSSFHREYKKASNFISHKQSDSVSYFRSMRLLIVVRYISCTTIYFLYHQH